MLRMLLLPILLPLTGSIKCDLSFLQLWIVKQYNKFMGGVDLCNMLLSLYRIKLRSRKWYMPIFHYLIKTSLTNGWLLFRRDMVSYASQSKPMSLLEFQAQVTGDLVLAGKIPVALVRRVGRLSLLLEPPTKRSKTTAAIAVLTGASRYDCVGHFVDFEKNSTDVDFAQQEKLMLSAWNVRFSFVYWKAQIASWNSTRNIMLLVIFQWLANQEHFLKLVQFSYIFLWINIFKIWTIFEVFVFMFND